MGTMVVVTLNSHHKSPGSIPLRSQIYSPLLPQNWHVENDSGGGSRGCMQVKSADSCRMRGILNHGREKITLLIAAAKYRSMREASNWQFFMELECGMINLVVTKSSFPCGRQILDKWLFYLSCCHKTGNSKATREREHEIVCRWCRLELGEWGERRTLG